MKGTGDSKGVLIVQTGFCQQRTVSEVKLMRVSKRVPIPFKQDKSDVYLQTYRLEESRLQRVQNG